MIEALKSDEIVNKVGGRFKLTALIQKRMMELMDGARPQSVTAVTQQIKPQIYPRVDDEATIVLKYPQAQAIVQASWISRERPGPICV